MKAGSVLLSLSLRWGPTHRLTASLKSPFHHYIIQNIHSFVVKTIFYPCTFFSTTVKLARLRGGEKPSKKVSSHHPPRKDANGISDVTIHSSLRISAKRWAEMLPKNEKRFSKAFTHQSNDCPPHLCRNHLVPNRIQQTIHTDPVTAYSAIGELQAKSSRFSTCLPHQSGLIVLN